MTDRRVADIIAGQAVLTLPPQATVREAARALAERGVGAVLVTEGGRLAGIFTERDALARVLAPGLDPEATHLDDVMTCAPRTIAPDTTAVRALWLMRELRCRHLPVLAGERLVGVVSMRDFNPTEFAAIEDQADRYTAIMEG